MKQQNKTYWFVKKTNLLTLSFLVLLLSGCRDSPDFSLEPEIEFENIIFETTIQVISGQTIAQDQFSIFLRFQDGDGDLGFTEDDLTDPRYESLRDTTIFDFDFDGVNDTTTSIRNFNATLFRKDEGEFVEVQSPATIGGSFEPLIGTDELGPIEGTLRHNVVTGNRANLFANSALEPNDTVIFEIFIIDRELNISNIITTSEVVLPEIEESN